MIKSYKFLFLVFSLITSSISLFGQGIKGTVKDAISGQGIPGASVVIEGRSSGTATDVNGNYTLRIAAGSYSLKVTSVGYQSSTASVSVVGTDFTTQAITLSESTSTLQEIAVIGSRSATARTNLQSAVPVDVISPKDLQGFSQVDVGQILNFVAPSFNSNRQTVADGTDHIDPASLRGLGPDQVLVLVNGKRRHTSSLVNINGSVGRGAAGTDMNVIPVAAIERIEVLRDGAAAQYGSDAIAGVINIVMKNNYKGLSASVNTGQNMTSMNYKDAAGNSKTQSITDGGVFQFDISKGFKLGKNGFLTLSGQINTHGRSNRSGEDNSPAIYLGSAGGFPGTITLADNKTKPSLFTVAGFANQTDFSKALITQDAALVAKNGYDRHNINYGNSAAQNYGFFANGGLPVGNKGNIYFTGGYTYRTGSSFGNPRLPNQTGNQPTLADGSLYYQNGFLPEIQSTIKDQSLLAGYKTKLGDWRMDISNTFGQNSFHFDVAQSGNASLPSSANVQTKFDAGTLTFKQNTTNLDFARTYEKMGVLKGFNVAFGAEFRYENFIIEAGEAGSYSGAEAKKIVPFAPIAYANGTVGSIPTTISGQGLFPNYALPGSQVFPGYQPAYAVDKSRTSGAGYLDLEGELFDRLLIGAAGRYESFQDGNSNFSNFSWKTSARLLITNEIALRGSASTGFRAPSLQQHYFQNISTQFVSGVPQNVLTVNNESDIAKNKIQVPALKPEISNSFTVGLTAKLAKIINLTIDAYQIEIKDRVVYSDKFAAAGVGIDVATTGINSVALFSNAADTRSRGVDIVANARIKNIGKGTLSTTISANFNKNEVTAVNGGAVIDNPTNNGGQTVAGQVVGNDVITGTKVTNPDSWYHNILFSRQQIAFIESFQPRSKINISATYSIGKFDITARTVRFGETKYVHNLYTNAQYKNADNTTGFYNTQFNRDANGNAFIDQTFNPIWITDLVLAYRATKMITATIGANNIFDVYPDQIYIDPRNALGTTDYSSGRDASNRGRLLYQPNQGGYNGRYVFAKLSLNF